MIPNADIAAQKRLLRAEIRRLKSQFSAAALAAKSLRVIEKLEAEPLFRAARAPMLYWSLPDEVCTHALIAKVLAEKRVVLPTVVGDELRPVELRSVADLREGAFHILEPAGCAVSDGEIDLIVLPGMAFSPDGGRLGRGRGYYDRFLSCCPVVPTVGLAFDFQVVSHVPAEPHDVKIGKVLFG